MATPATDPVSAFREGDVEASRTAHEQKAAPEIHGGAGSDNVKSLVFGGVDGAVTTFATIASVSGGGEPLTAVLVLGFANLIAEAISMVRAAACGLSHARAQAELALRTPPPTLDGTQLTPRPPPPPHPTPSAGDGRLHLLQGGERQPQRRAGAHRGALRGQPRGRARRGDRQDHGEGLRGGGRRGAGGHPGPAQARRVLQQLRDGGAGGL